MEGLGSVEIRNGVRVFGAGAHGPQPLTSPAQSQDDIIMRQSTPMYCTEAFAQLAALQAKEKKWRSRVLTWWLVVVAGILFALRPSSASVFQALVGALDSMAVAPARPALAQDPPTTAMH